MHSGPSTLFPAGLLAAVFFGTTAGDAPARVAPGCAAFLDSVRKAYNGNDPRYLEWEVGLRPCISAQAQEVFYLQGNGFAILENRDLSRQYWQQALALEGPFRERALRQLWLSARLAGDSAEAEVYLLWLESENPHSSLLPGMRRSLKTKTAGRRQSGGGPSTRHGIRSLRRPSYSRELATNQGQWEWSAWRGSAQWRAAASAELISALVAGDGSPGGPDQFLAALTLAWARGGWHADARLGQAYDYRRLVFAEGPAGYSFEEGWSGPSWALSAGRMGSWGGPWGTWGLNALASQMREDWRAFLGQAFWSKTRGPWDGELSGAGEWNAIDQVGPVFPGFPESPTYEGFWTLELGVRAGHTMGPHRFGVAGGYDFQRDVYSGPDPLELVPHPGRSHTLGGRAEYDWRPRPWLRLRLHLGGGWDWNRYRDLPSGAVSRAGLALEAGP